MAKGMSRFITRKTQISSSVTFQVMSTSMRSKRRHHYGLGLGLEKEMQYHNMNYNIYDNNRTYHYNDNN